MRHPGADFTPILITLQDCPSGNQQSPVGKSHRDHFPQSTRYDGQAALLACGFSFGNHQFVRGTPSLLSEKLDVVFRSFDIQTKGMSSNFSH